MIFETKFNINDTVAFLNRNTIHTGKIVTVNGYCSSKKELVQYKIYCNELGIVVNRNQNLVFATEEELTKSLINK